MRFNAFSTKHMHTNNRLCELGWAKNTHRSTLMSIKTGLSFLIFPAVCCWNNKRWFKKVNVSSADLRLNLITKVNPKGTLPHTYLRYTHTNTHFQLLVPSTFVTKSSRGCEGMPVCPKPLTSRSIAATHKNRLKWTTSYGSKSVQPEGRRRWRRNDRGEKTGEEALCLAGEAWDSEWQENTGTVGRAVGRSQLFLCVCKGLSGHSSTRSKHRTA